MSVGSSAPATDSPHFLSKAAALLSSSLAFDDVLSQTIAAALPALGDFGFFDVVKGDGVRRTVRAHEAPDTEALPILAEARAVLTRHYARPFDSIGFNLYRDGRDSVAWHGDTIGRGKTIDTMVAIVSVGDPRRLHLRPRLGGADAIVVEMGHGDLVVMGGSCQRTWEHAVPKVAHAGPRISVQFRPLNVF